MKYGWVKEKKHMLFEGNEWDIYKAEDAKYPHVKLVVFAHHRGCQSEKKDLMNCWWLGDHMPKCIMCQTKVPDSIQALIMLYTYGQETA